MSIASMTAPWRLDLGANVESGGGVRFRVWAPNAQRVEVVLERDGQETRHETAPGTPLTPMAYHGAPPLRGVPTAPAPSRGEGRPTHTTEHSGVSLDRELPTRFPLSRGRERGAGGEGMFAATVPDARAGDRYRYALDGGQPFPDPCSRSQPDGPHGASEVVDPGQYQWTDAGWQGLGPEGLVIYELHVGTFTPEGTFDAVIPRLLDLKALGVTALEIMPVAEFPGRRNWGYDGVDLYAPYSGYGGPEGLRRLVDAAHAHGLGALLDVVYNHFGPDGNYLRVYADEYFTDRHTTPWGDAVNYDGPGSEHVRHFVVQNARYWLEEYHLDGLRLDATHAIVDTSARHLLAEIAEAVHSVQGRRTVVIAEDHRNLVEQIRPVAQGGIGLDGVWTDDFHHALRTCLTPEREAYYANYTGRLEDVAECIEQGFLFQGRKRPATGELRGTRVTDEPASAFVYCSENHDQVGNRAFGERLAHLIDRERYLVASAVLLTVPETVLLFQGQEFAASAPFQFFTDHTPELGKLVTEGRRKEFAEFVAFADPAQREKIPDPQAEGTFRRCIPDWSERERHADVLSLYQALLALRRTDPVLKHQDRGATRARVLAEGLLAVRRWHAGAERLLLANFGEKLVSVDAAKLAALDAPEAGWQRLFATPNAADADLLLVPARGAVLLAHEEDAGR